MEEQSTRADAMFKDCFLLVFYFLHRVKEKPLSTRMALLESPKLWLQRGSTELLIQEHAARRRR